MKNCNFSKRVGLILIFKILFFGNSLIQLVSIFEHFIHGFKDYFFLYLKNGKKNITTPFMTIINRSSLYAMVDLKFEHLRYNVCTIVLLSYIE